MDQRERSGSLEDVLRLSISGALAFVWTALPGEIVDFDEDLQTASVQPTVQAEVRLPDGSASLVTMPLLLDCPVYFPQGGQAVFTFPVSPGDECLAVFASRCIDSWWQSGGVQPPATFRMHNLSDGFAFAGFRSKPNKLSAFSTTKAQLRSLDGNTLVEIDPAGQLARVKASGGITLEGPVHCTSTVQVDGATTIDGNATFSGSSVTHDGKNIGKDHKHSGVQAGGANTGNPI